MNLNSWANWALLLSGFTTFFAVIVAGLAWVLKHTVMRILDEEIKPSLLQLQNNGGKSMKDVVDKTWLCVQEIIQRDGRTEARLEVLEKKII
jgi:hypothetical protein